VNGAGVAHLRSLLFVPASDPRKIAKSSSVGADAVILDLEDAVAPTMRARAREGVRAALEADASLPVFVRINHPSAGQLDEDLAAAAHSRLTGVVIPKADHAEDVLVVEQGLTRAFAESDHDDPGVVVLPLVESCSGLRRCYDLATASPRVVGLAFSSGEAGDFMADLDGRWTADGLAMAYPRSKLVCETRAAGLHWPVDGVFMAFGDDESLATECARARALGFQAKMAIHPRQIPIINDAFTPTREQVAYSRGLLAAYEQALQEGRGAFGYEGAMVDRANVAQARRVLSRARVDPGPSRTVE